MQHSSVGGDPRRTFLTLDGMRGIAAILTLIRHLGDATLSDHLGSVYLAVDMFFALSGFVLMHSYRDRLATRTLGVRRFAVARLIRFYPFYLLGTAIGIAWIGSGYAITHGIAPTPGELAFSMILALLFLPVPPHPVLEPRRNLYPYNFSAWSLLMEFLVNILFALIVPRLTDRRLAALLAGAFLALLASSWLCLGLDSGWGWNRPFGDAWAGPPRVLFSFFAGAGVYRLWESGRFRLRLPVWLPLVLLMLIFLPPSSFGGHKRALYDVLAAAVLFPAVIFLGACTDPVRSASAMRWLGLSSYGVYAIHSPLVAMLGDGVAAAAPGLGRLAHTGVNLGIAVALSAAAILLDRVYDRPFRKALTRLASRLWDRPVPLDRERAL